VNLDLLGFLLVIVIAFALTARCTIFSGAQARRMKWRARMRMRPGPGFATIAELYVRWGRWSAWHHGRWARPSMRWRRRAITPATEYAVRLGRGPLFRTCWARKEDQTIVIAPPRIRKSQLLADRIINHPGPALVTESRPDIYTATAGFRHRRGPVEMFNPELVAGLPSTFRWAITDGCDNPGEAYRRASDLVGAVADTGEMRWWVEKSASALAAAMHCAGLLGDDMAAVWAWSNHSYDGLISHAASLPGVSDELISALTELERPGKTADSIRITMSKALQWLGIPEIRAIVTGRAAVPYDVGAFTDSCGTIYMLAPGGDNSPEAPLFRCFGGYVHRQAKMHAQTMPARKLDPGLLFAIDELHLMPVDLPHWMADSAGSNVEVVAVIHSTGQLEDKYGKAGERTVWSTAGTKIFLPGITDTDTLKAVSMLGGTMPHGEARENPCIPVEFLTRLPDLRALVFRMNLTPTVVKFRPVFSRIGVRLHGLPPPPVLHADPATIEIPATLNGHRPTPPTWPTAPLPATDDDESAA
jgi:hypothetical protein